MRLGFKKKKLNNQPDFIQKLKRPGSGAMLMSHFHPEAQCVLINLTFDSLTKINKDGEHRVSQFVERAANNFCFQVLHCVSVSDTGCGT